MSMHFDMMVGYILGRGDRHPSNLMLDRHTGKVIHIDFGDCFKVAMKREKYPEKIPLVNTGGIWHRRYLSLNLPRRHDRPSRAQRKSDGRLGGFCSRSSPQLAYS